jgi:hypothetical protein
MTPYHQDNRYPKPGISYALLWVSISLLLGTIGICTGIYLLFKP